MAKKRDDARHILHVFRVNVEEHARLVAAAQEVGLASSTFDRRSALSVAKRALTPASVAIDEPESRLERLVLEP